MCTHKARETRNQASRVLPLFQYHFGREKGDIGKASGRPRKEDFRVINPSLSPSRPARLQRQESEHIAVKNTCPRTSVALPMLYSNSACLVG